MAPREAGDHTLHHAVALSTDAPACAQCHGGNRGGALVDAPTEALDVRVPLKRTIHEIRSGSWRFTAVLGGIFLLLGLWLADAVCHSVARPLESVSRLSSSFAEGDLTPRFRVR